MIYEVAHSVLKFPILDIQTGAVRGQFSLIVPPPWRHLTEREPEMTALADPGGLLALIDCGVELDGKKWLHVSFSRKDRLPTYQDLVRVKEEIVGRDRKAIQVFPAASEHVNAMPYCLHLWAPIDHDPLPDFSRGNRMI